LGEQRKERVLSPRQHRPAQAAARARCQREHLPQRLSSSGMQQKSALPPSGGGSVLKLTSSVGFRIRSPKWTPSRSSISETLPSSTRNTRGSPCPKSRPNCVPDDIGETYTHRTAMTDNTTHVH